MSYRSKVLEKAAALRHNRRQGGVSAETIAALDLVGFDWDKRRPEWLSYEEARSVVQAAGIKTSQEYQKWNRPRNIPSNPSRVYLPWPGMSEFLGTGRPRVREFLSHAEAMAYMQEHTTIRTGEEFSKWKDRPHFIPCNPHKRYKEWKSWEVFLGKNYKPVWMDVLSYDEARDLVRKQGIKTSEEFRQWKDRPAKLPATPYHHYKLTGEWKGWGEFLGTGNLRYKTFWSFKKARAYVRKMGIKSRSAYERVRVDGLPRHPEMVYRGKGWRGTLHFFGLSASKFRQEVSKASKLGWEKHRVVHGDFLPYEKARALVRELGITNRPSYRRKRTKSLPCNPDAVYKSRGGWRGYTHFFSLDGKTRREIRAKAARKGWATLRGR